MMRKFAKLYVMLAVLGLMTAHAQTTYKLSSKSNLQIAGTSTVSDWVVKSGVVSGQMIFTPSDKKAKDKEVQSGVIEKTTVELDATSIKSEKGETMDNKIYKALKSDVHPKITFSMTKPLQIRLREPSKLSASGNVNLAGVVRPMTFELSHTYKDNALHFAGSKTMKLSDFDIEAPTAMFGQIVTGDEITIQLDLYFIENK